MKTAAALFFAVVIFGGMGFQCWLIGAYPTPHPYTLVIVAPLAPLVAIEFNSEKACIEAGHAIRDTYTEAGRGGQLNCYAR
jgi:hypothetical protein